MNNYSIKLSIAKLIIEPNNVKTLNDVVVKLNNFSDISYVVINTNTNVVEITVDDIVVLKQLLNLFT